MNISKIITILRTVLMMMPGVYASNHVFPSGAPVDGWFADISAVDIGKLGKEYVVTEYGVLPDSTIVQTEALQHVIDLAADSGGGVITIPEGTIMSGSLFFRPGTHLHIAEGGKLKGIDDIRHYSIVPTRLEGQTINYFAALVNADRCDGFTVTGPGTIDGNGLRFYEEFWLRRKVNPKCTNLEALRPRLMYISNSSDVTVDNVDLIYSGFWTNHLYNCERVKYLRTYIYAPDENPRGPSTDAIDLDVCADVLISGCTINVGDDAVCLKGGKGTYVDTIPGNGPVSRVVIEKCRFGRANAGVTFGSEAWDCHDVIMRDCEFDGTSHMILFKMRPDTPQQYGDVLVENCRGLVKNGVEVQKWTQFFNPVERDPMPESGIKNVTIKDIDISCTRDFFREAKGDYYTLDDFVFSNIKAVDTTGKMDTSAIRGCQIDNVSVVKNEELGRDGAGVIDDKAN